MKSIIRSNQKWIDETWEKIDQKLSKVAVRSREKLPYSAVDGIHDNLSEKDVCWWTNGFFGGMMWLMYRETGNPDYRLAAEESEKKMDEAMASVDELHHDVGFMWHLLSGANYRITGNLKSRTRNYYAAASLFSRYNVDADFIQAWNGKGQQDYSIIDCLMNLPLLYWASHELKNDRFKRIAVRQMEMSLKDHIRPDGSVNHIVDHYHDHPGVKRILAGQGYSETSCWSRGLAWAIYGSVLSYIHTENIDYLNAAKKTADYFIEHCKRTEYLPVIDFLAPKEPVYYDSTAGVCAACGMLEIAKHTGTEESKKYALEAINILKACDLNFCNYNQDEDPLVLMGSERYPHAEEEKKGVHIPIIYGDFFYVEAMLKLKGSEFLIW